MVKEASRASDGGAAPPGEANAPWHARPAEEALAEHGTDAERGLPPERVEALRARFGENALPEPPRPFPPPAAFPPCKRARGLIALLGNRFSHMNAVCRNISVFEIAITFWKFKINIRISSERMQVV